MCFSILPDASDEPRIARVLWNLLRPGRSTLAPHLCRYAIKKTKYRHTAISSLFDSLQFGPKKSFIQSQLGPIRKRIPAGMHFA